MTGPASNQSLESLAKLQPNTAIELPEAANFSAAGHLWSEPEIHALMLALAARRPLLVRGEAGSGKSQIARAAAVALGNAPLFVEVIHARFEALDLLYRFDTISRLADAQGGKPVDDNNRYMDRGRLWLALEGTTPTTTPVLLIDEIDKADADIPNTLLEVLGTRSFSVPLLGYRTIGAPGHRLPLIVITTNEERELPAAFVRRCAVLNLNPPADRDGFIEWLLSRAQVHRQLNVVAEVRRLAAEQVWSDRDIAHRSGLPKVGLAEYIDLLTALTELTAGIGRSALLEAQQALFEKVNAYALVKHAQQDQRRRSVSGAGAASSEPQGDGEFAQ